MHVRVQGVDVALDRALSNLVENAVRAAPAGSTVRVGSGQIGGWAWLAVSDSGPGLPANPGDRVGLGLSIVTQIAEAHGGELASFPGTDDRGTTMVVWLPIGSTDLPVPEFSPFTDSS
jgi:signal transduction histidine kinase